MSGRRHVANSMNLRYPRPANQVSPASSPTIGLFLPSLAGGGAERVFVQLANAFVALGFRVDLALASAKGPYLDELCTDVRVIDFGASGVLASLPKLADYLRSERPDVILSGLDHANIIAIVARSISRSKTRCVVSVRCVPTAVYREDRSVRHWIALQLVKVTYEFADAVIANSRTVAADLLQSLRVSRRKLNVVYNPLDIDRIEEMSRAAVDHPWLTRREAPIVLGVGRLSVLKDFPTLIRAFAKVRSKHDCRLVILGDGPDRGKLESLIRELRMSSDTYLPGFVNNPFPWMRHAGVLVSSSLTEGCPNVLMQGLACGTPVVSTDCLGGSAEILQCGKWGRLVPVGDVTAMAEAILTTLDSATLPDVRRRADDFALNEIARQYLRILFPA